MIYSQYSIQNCIFAQAIRQNKKNMTKTILSTDKPQKMGPVFGQDSFNQHEEVVFFNDEESGLKAIVGIHNSVLGPALGGVRMWNYASEWEALNDVLRLSRGMTYKAAISGLNQGGGKAVIIGDSKTQKTDALMRKFGEFIHSLGGKYLTAEDMGMDTHDMDIIRELTPYVTGISEDMGGSGNPSPFTALGVYMGMKGAAKYQFGSENLTGKKVLVQGIGHVGEILVKYLTEEGAIVTINDINEEALERVSNKYKTSIHRGKGLYSLDVDIYAPCAMGATLNDVSISQLKAKVIAGAANNQLAEEIKHAKLLQKRGIAYAPDFLVNAGGIINIYREVANISKEEAITRTENIFHTTQKILYQAQEKKMSSHQVALDLAQKRIDDRKAGL